MPTSLSTWSQESAGRTPRRPPAESPLKLSLRNGRFELLRPVYDDDWNPNVILPEKCRIAPYIHFLKMQRIPFAQLTENRAGVVTEMTARLSEQRYVSG